MGSKKGKKKKNIKKITPLSKKKDYNKDKGWKIHYVVAHNNSGIFHPIELYPNLQVSTGLPYFESFNSKVQAYAKFKNKVIFPSDIVINDNEDGE